MNLPDPAVLASVNRPQEVALCNQAKVWVFVDPTGQELPSRSDALLAKATLYLPAGPDRWLAAELQFDSRLELMDASLGQRWGDEGAPPGVTGAFRNDSKDLTGHHWDTLLRRAVRYLYGEVRKLDRALERRQAQLRVGGWEHYAARYGLAPMPVVGEERPKRPIIRNGGLNREAVR